MQHKIIKIALWILSFLFIVRAMGWVLDYHSEIVHNQTYLKNDQGIIYGKDPKAINRGGDTAIVILHGFMSYPTSHDITIKALKDRLPNVDFYVPVLPYHGRGLAASKDFNAQNIEKFVKDYLYKIVPHYKKIYVIGHSFGGTIISKLMIENDFPKNAVAILQAPAIYLKQNSLENRIKLALMTLFFRDYCPYTSLGCGRDMNSVDEVGFEKEIEQVVSGHVIMPAVQNLFAYELKNIDNLKKIDQDYYIIMTPDDNKVDYGMVKKDCDGNPKCQMHKVDSGHHAFHWGKNRKQYQDILVDLIKG